MAFQYRSYDGYGRYSARMIQALKRCGVEVMPLLLEMASAPTWLQRESGISWDSLTISCHPPPHAIRIPGRQWLYTMTEGSLLPDGWAMCIGQAGVERVLVPCEHNAIAFRKGLYAEGFDIPVHVVMGGTDPGEFPLSTHRSNCVYTFLSMGDRGSRKGWVEAYQAFYQEFGTPQETPDVRLVIKARTHSNMMLESIRKGINPDGRIQIWIEDLDYVGDMFEFADCVVLPSRSEGFGMPHREAAMMGKPVITQRYGGLDDGNTDKWSIPVEKGTIEKIPEHFDSIKGDWKRADIDELAAHMRGCYENPRHVEEFGRDASAWLALNQTWDHSARRIEEMIERYA